MAKKKGICRNYDNCDLADNKEIQEVEATEFVCAECGKPLYELEKTGIKPRNGSKLWLLILCTVVVCGLVLGVVFIIKNRKATSDKVENTAVEIVDKDNGKDSTKQDDEAGDNSITEKPVNEKTEPEQTKNLSSDNMLTLSYGKYKGDIKNGYPHGSGRLTYTKARQINKYDSKARKAEAGDYVDGEFFNGFFISGYHYNSKNELIERITIGVGPEDSFESK